MRSALVPSRLALTAAAIAGLMLASAAPAVAEAGPDIAADRVAPASVTASPDRFPPDVGIPTPRPCKWPPSWRMLPKPCGPDVPPPWHCEFSVDKPIGCEIIDPPYPPPYDPYPPIVIAAPSDDISSGLPGPYDPVTDAKELVA